MKLPVLITAITIPAALTVADAAPRKAARAKAPRAVPAVVEEAKAASADSTAVPADTAKAPAPIAASDSAQAAAPAAVADSATAATVTATADSAAVAAVTADSAAQAPAPIAASDSAIAATATVADSATAATAPAAADSATAATATAAADSAAVATAPADSAAQAPAPIAASDSATAATATVADSATADTATAAADSAAVAAVTADSAAQAPAPIAASDSATAATATVADSATADSTATAAAADSAAVAAVPADSAQVPAPIAATDSAIAAAAAPADSATADSSAKAAEAAPVIINYTELSGDLHGFLKADKSPYLVKEDISVNYDQVLVVEPGVKFAFAPGSGMNVKGQLVVAGNANSKVTFEGYSVDGSKSPWKGIYVYSDKGAEIRGAEIKGAENGIVVENSSLKLEASTISGTTSRGVFSRNAKVSISDCSFSENEGAALFLDSYTEAEVERVNFNKNTVALFNANLARTQVLSTKIEDNNYGVVDMGNSQLTFDNSTVVKNTFGVSSSEVLDKSVFESVHDNASDFGKDNVAVATALGSSPEIPGVERRNIRENDKIGDLINASEEDAIVADSSKSGWTLSGNLILGGNYHYVKTRKNHNSFAMDISGDSIQPGDHFKNTFQVPGLGGEASAYLMMQSSDGKTIEFKADLTSDRWNYFAPDPVTVSYSDQHNNLVLGDFQKIGGDIYMSNLPIFGAGYTLSLFKNNADQPLLELDGFFGEARRPYITGERHPSIYNDYIEEGEAQAQRIAYGASLKWAPVRRFDATFGFIYANDEIDDPLLRDGDHATALTSEPLQESFTLYADGNWLFYPGDIELKGMIAVGRADTANVFQERAVNKVFSNAGLSVSSYGKLRELMTNESKINALSSEELEEIFGGNTPLSRSEMRDSLRTLIRDAKLLKKEEDGDLEDSRVLGLNWGSQNFAIGASLYWNIYKTTLSGHIKYVGEDFYSAGSADQLSDTREFGGRLEQIITNFWTLGFNYDINVENAAKGKKTNLIGLGEGTHWGFFGEASDSWKDEHELDNDRTKYIQNFGLDNSFKIGSNVNFSVGYNLEYRTQYRPYQLHGDYILEDGIYRDDWFAARKGKAVTQIEDGEYITTVDSARWAQYMGLASENYLASNFQERIFKNAWKADLSIKAPHTLIKLGGRWTLRTDDSKFHKDSLIKDIDLDNTTWGKLGYYFGGADYFEHSYPVSLTSTFKKVQNQFSVTPRFKSYERDDMSETEFTIDDELEISFLNRFLIFTINGEFRYLTTSWDEDDSEMDENEMDVLGGLSLRINHNRHWFSEWYTGAAMYYRPDNRSDEYKDIYGGVRINYAF